MEILQCHHVTITLSEERDLPLEPIFTVNFQHAIAKCIGTMTYNYNGIHVI